MFEDSFSEISFCLLCTKSFSLRKEISFSDKISEKELIDFKNTNKICDDEIAWEITSDNSKIQEISFPVVKNYFTVAMANEFSKLLSIMPTYEKNWLYISPKHEMSLLNFLEKCDANQNNK